LSDRGGQAAPREFCLNLNNTFADHAPVTADQFGRLVEAASKHDPDLARNLAGLFDREPDWIVGYGKARPADVVAEQGSLIRQAIERSHAFEHVFRDAGFHAFASGRDVRKLTGHGIRSKDAAFDPDKASSTNIFASLAGLRAAFGLPIGVDPADERGGEPPSQ
jgi:hypothetical protein